MTKLLFFTIGIQELNFSISNSYQFVPTMAQAQHTFCVLLNFIYYFVQVILQFRFYDDPNKGFLLELLWI